MTFDRAVLAAIAQGVISRHQEAALASLRIRLFCPTDDSVASGQVASEDMAKNRPA
jgi:hypothetical protein